MVRFAVIAGLLLFSTGALAEEAKPPASAETVAVHLAGRGISLVHDIPSKSDEKICDAPCDARVPIAARYRVRSSEESSGIFTLSGDSRIDARLKSRTREGIGGYLLIGGVGMALWSIAFLVLGAGGVAGSKGSDSLYLLSGVGAGASLALGVPGVLLLVNNKTEVRINGLPTVAAGTPPAAGLGLSASF